MGVSRRCARLGVDKGEGCIGKRDGYVKRGGCFLSKCPRCHGRQSKGGRRRGPFVRWYGGVGIAGCRLHREGVRDSLSWRHVRFGGTIAGRCRHVIGSQNGNINDSSGRGGSGRLERSGEGKGVGIGISEGRFAFRIGGGVPRIVGVVDFEGGGASGGFGDFVGRQRGHELLDDVGESEAIHLRWTEGRGIREVVGLQRVNEEGQRRRERTIEIKC